MLDAFDLNVCGTDRLTAMVSPGVIEVVVSNEPVTDMISEYEPTPPDESGTVCDDIVHLVVPNVIVSFVNT